MYLSAYLWWHQVRGFQSNDEDDETDDDYSTDDDSQSPIDDVDPFIFFVETIQGIAYSVFFRPFISDYFITKDT